MPTMRIAAILAVLLITQGYCRPDKTHKDDVYADDTPQDDYEEEPELDSESNKPTSNDPPQMLSKTKTFEVRPGDNVELPCHVLNADDLAISWSKDGKNLFLGSTLVDDRLKNKMETKSDNSLVIYNVTESDSSDNYTCEILASERKYQVSHHVHVINKSTELAGDGRPIRVIPGKRVEVNENESVKFGCEANYPNKTLIKWSHKGERLRNGEILENDGNYIYIKHATRHNSGRYQCYVEDSSNKPPHEAIEVIVKYKPEIEVEHEIVHTGMGQTTQLACKVFGHPRAKVTWVKNQKPIANKKDRKMLNEDKALRTLTIEHTTKHDLGTYTCIGINQIGEAHKDIIVTATPAKPKFIGGEIADDETTMILKWHVESFSPILEYKLEYRQKDDAEWTSVSPQVKNSDGNVFTVEHALKDLHPGSSYEAKLAARNEFGWSPHSASHKFDKEYVADEPQNVKGKEKSTSDATMNRGLAFAPTLLVLLTYIYSCV